MTTRHVVLHGHFYQPPRADPWYEEVPRQPSAWPEHDWNARVCEECYAPNIAARRLRPDGRVLGFVDNYASLSFDFGPTLLEWLQIHAEEVYAAVIAADRDSRQRLGHGNAMAQAHGHLIMPLASERDRRTQVLWGVADFAARFGRDPEGMWLPETAVDTATLEALAAHGIRFTVLAPSQAARFREAGRSWHDAGETIDGRVPYRAHLPSGRSIDLFFYDGPLSRGIAFEGLLRTGERLVGALLGAFDPTRDGNQLVHAATDGETYGHHHRFGDMALAFAVDTLRQRPDVSLTNYAAYLADNPPKREVEINERTSWSCAHGVERWRADCGCQTGGDSGWNQQWRGPLRAALDELGRGLGVQFEQHAGPLLRDPWGARDAYVALLLGGLDVDRGGWLGAHLAAGVDARGGSRALAWLESQRHAMAMFTSCGWFFNDVAGIETEQVLLHAARALQLARDAGGADLEPVFIEGLRHARSNRAQVGSGADLWRQRVAPRIVSPARVAAARALLALLGQERTQLGCYATKLHVHAAADRDELRATVAVRDPRERASDELLVEARIDGDDLVATVSAPAGGEVTFGARQLQGADGSWLLEAVLRTEEARVLDAQRRLLARASGIMGTDAGKEVPQELRAAARAIAEADLRELLAGSLSSPGRLDRVRARLRLIGAPRATLEPRTALAIRRALGRAARGGGEGHHQWLAVMTCLARLRRELAPETDAWRAQRRVHCELSGPNVRDGERGAWLELARLLDVDVDSVGS